jgi:hypothetical protein
MPRKKYEHLSKEFKDKVWDRFYTRQDNYVNAIAEEFGLSLWLTTRILNEHKR